MSPHDEGAAALRKAKRLIADYVNHIADRAYISRIWTVADIPVIDELLASMLGSGDPVEPAKLTCSLKTPSSLRVECRPGDDHSRRK